MTVVIVAGSRVWYCRPLAERIVGRLKARYGDDLLIRHGAAPGIDQSFEDAARKLGVRTEPMPAEWDNLDLPGAIVRQSPGGRPYVANAGPLRNRAMIAKGAAFLVACRRFPEWTRGTLDCTRQALASGLPVYLIEGEDGEPSRITEA